MFGNIQHGCNATVAIYRIISRLLAIRMVCVGLWLLLPATPIAAISGETPAKAGYTLGIFPYLPAARLEKLYAPVANSFSEILVRPVQIRSRPDFERFREAVGLGRYDIVFIQPFDFVRLPTPRSYQPIARWQGTLQAVFVVLADNPLKNLKELRNHSIAMPDRDAAVSLLAKQSLLNEGLGPKQVSISYFSNHFACLKQVILHKADVCITAPAPLKMFQKRTDIKLRILTRSDTIPTPMFAVHNRVSAEQREKLQELIVHWHKNSAGKAILKNLRLAHFIRANTKDYDPVLHAWHNLSKHL